MAMPAVAPATDVRRVAIVADTGAVLAEARGPLLAGIAARRHRVLAVAPDFATPEAHALDELGIERAVIAAEASAFRLLSDWRVTAALKSVLAGWSPHVVLGCGSRAMVYAALAAKAAGASRTVLIVDALPENRFSGPLAPDELPAWRYRQALRAADAAVFHNREDAALLQRLGILPPSLSVSVVAGAGIDVGEHGLVPLPSLGGGLVFLMAAPLDERRGVIEYCEAACEVRRHAANTRFLLAGPEGLGPHAIAAADLPGDGAVEYLGAALGVRAALARCHVFVYPSHAEGMPQAVLEAMAAGRPIITTDIPGCRDTVDERVNGCLVAPRSSGALAEAMASFLKRPDLIASIARASRAKAERLADARIVNVALMDALGLD